MFSAAAVAAAAAEGPFPFPSSLECTMEDDLLLVQNMQRSIEKVTPAGQHRPEPDRRGPDAHRPAQLHADQRARLHHHVRQHHHSQVRSEERKEGRKEGSDEAKSESNSGTPKMGV